MDRGPIYAALLMGGATILALLAPTPPPPPDALAQSGVAITVATPLGVCGHVRADSPEVAAGAFDALVGDGQIAGWGWDDDEVDVEGIGGDHAGACAAVMGAFGGGS